jgi:protein phosphatase
VVTGVIETTAPAAPVAPAEPAHEAVVSDADVAAETIAQNGAVAEAETAMPAISEDVVAGEEVVAAEAGAVDEAASEAASDATSAPEAVLEAAPEEAVTSEAAEAAEAGEEVDEVRPIVTAELSADDEVETAPADGENESEELMPLPVNAVVAEKYLIQSQLHASPERNLYRVVARQQQRCGTCGRLSDIDADTCYACDKPLDGQPAAEFYLMAESFKPEALVQDPELMKRHLYHPSLVPVVDFFNYKPYGRTRYFAVAEPRGGVRLSQLSLPRPATQVLTWAMQLADALDYLHNQGVVGAGAEADDILVQGDRASLASLQNAQAATGDEETLREQRSMDLARLAGTIYEAFTGSPATLTPEGVLPVPAGAPEQMSATFRAAIEPVQGAARPISVAQWRDMLAVALQAITELERPGRPVSFMAAHLTSVGRLREQNQDSYGVVEFSQASEERPYYLGLYVIADGLGGHKGGEIASALAVQTFTGEIMSRVLSPLASASGERALPSNEAILQALTRGTQAANDRIFKSRNNRQNDMGTTLVTVLLTGGKLYAANVGDSRLYILSKLPEQVEETTALDATRPLVMGTSPLATSLYLQGRGELNDGTPADTIPVDRSEGFALQQVSVDHSLVHRLVELGQLDAEEAKVHPHRNFIYRSLGGPPPIEVDTFVRTLRPGERVLLCSDGLNSMVEDVDIENALKEEPTPAEACRRLVELANEAGGHDNITTIVIDVLDYLPYTEPL